MTPLSIFQFAQEIGATEYTLCLSKVMLIDGEDGDEKLTAVLDIPLHGMATNTEEKEFRLVLKMDEETEKSLAFLGDSCKIHKVDDLEADPPVDVKALIQEAKEAATYLRGVGRPGSEALAERLENALKAHEGE